MYSAGSVYLLCMTWHRICAYTSTNVLFSLAWLTLGWKASSFSRFCIYYSNWQLFHQPPQTAPPLFCSSSSVCYLMTIQQHVGSEWNASHAQEQWKQREDEYVVKHMLLTRCFPTKKKLENTWFPPWLLPAIFEIRYFIPDSFPGFWTHLCLLRLCLCSAFRLGPENIEDGMGGIPSDHFLGGSMMVYSSCMFPKTYHIDFLYFGTWMWCFHKICCRYACANTNTYQWVNGNKRACICSTVCILDLTHVDASAFTIYVTPKWPKCRTTISWRKYPLTSFSEGCGGPLNPKMHNDVIHNGRLGHSALIGTDAVLGDGFNTFQKD